MPETVEVAPQTEKVSIDTLSPSEYKAARKEGVTEVDVPKTEQKVDEQPKKLSGAAAQKRIDRLVKHTSALELEIAELKKPKAETTKETVKADAGDPEPKKEDFTEYDAYIKAQAKWEVRQEMKAEREKEIRTAKDEKMKAQFDGYREQVAEARARYDDWDEVVEKSDIKAPSVIQLPIVKMKNGADVTYFLAQHPEVCKELSEMDDIEAILAVGRISVALEGNEKEDEDDEKEVEPEKPKETEKLTSKAPTPIRPVASGATKSTKALDQLDFTAYKLARKVQRGK